MIENFRFLGVNTKAKNDDDLLLGWLTSKKFPLINYACWASSRYEHMYYKIGHCMHEVWFYWVRCNHNIWYIAGYPCYTHYNPHKWASNPFWFTNHLTGKRLDDEI